MAHVWTYDTAASFWSRSRQNPEDAWEAYVSAERYLLDHRPRTPGEAAQVLAVLVDQGSDRRSDGRDVEAVARVRRYLHQLARYEADQTPMMARAVA
ncbi:hypothetical protein N0B44_19780 [Roseibacterium beibuensis]|uniref:hypothetical protein n=1 Tax=[Roseibacterium] beibuensis TaxID=1193142 RepID=UPI00217DF3C6|nr:hypothetical protein [Roseibacterium beibuensis]MCS6625158.1 hypothetical protein [Roseibacterium beibuensis]